MPMKLGSPCPFCRKVFASAGAFDSHLRSIHAEHAHSFYHNSGPRAAPDPEDFHQNLDDEYEELLLRALESDQIASPEGEYLRDSDLESDSEEDEEDEPPPEELSKTSRKSFEGAGASQGDVEGYAEEEKEFLTNPWKPFRNATEFKLAHFFLRSDISLEAIDSFFRDSLGLPVVSYRSAYAFQQLLGCMETPLGPDSWNHAEATLGGTAVSYYYRNPLSCIQYLLRQRAYKEDLVYGPEHWFEDGERQYGELHTADWWWDMQETLPKAATLVPIICASDATQLTAFSGDKKAWPIYLTIGNLKSTTRNKPSSMAMVLLALLPVPPKSKKDSSVETHFTIHKVLENIFESLRGPGETGIMMDCADGKRRLCFPVLCAWIADHMEHVVLHNIKTNACPKCEVEPDKLQEPPASDSERPERDHAEYQQLVEEYEETGNITPVEELARRGLKTLFNAFWTLPRIRVSELFKPDILHTIYLGILKHMMEWIQSFLKKHKRLELFDDIWKSIGPYPGFTAPTKAYREVSQWQGKEMRNLGRVITVAFAAALRNPNDTQRASFRAAIRCITNLIDFHLMIQYRTHTESTLNYMEKYLNSFHEHKEIFREFRTGKKGKYWHARIEDNRNGTKRRRIEHDGAEKAVAEEQEALEKPHFNFIKMHLLQHFRSHVKCYGNIPIFSTDTSELAHRIQIKESYRRSNKNNAATQIIDNYFRLHTFEMRLLNVRAVLLETPAEARTIPASDLEIFSKPNTNIAANQIKVPTIPKRRLRGLDPMVRTLWDIAGTMEIPDLNHSIIDYARFNDDKDLLASSQDLPKFWRLPAERFNMLQVPVTVFQEDDVYDIHNIRCTGTYTFRGGKPRNDWVWVYVGDRGYGDLGERIPGILKCLLKLRDVNTGRSYRFAVVESLIPVDGGTANPYNTLIRVQRKIYKTPGRANWVVNVRSIIGMAHLIEYGENQWLVNNRIDLKTWNDVYMR